MEGTSSTESPTPSLREEGLLTLMRALPPDVLGKIVLDYLSLCDEKRLWAEDGLFRTVYTWCLAAHRESGLRRRKEAWPLIRSIIAVFSRPSFDWTNKVHMFGRPYRWCRKERPRGAMRTEWDSIKHGDMVLLHFCKTGAVDCSFATLANAVRAGAITVVRYLVEECRVSPSGDDNFALRYAAEDGRADVVKYLLDLPLARRIFPFMKSHQAFCRAAAFGHTEVIKLLLDLPADRRPGRQVVQEVLSQHRIKASVVAILEEHLAGLESAEKRRKIESDYLLGIFQWERGTAPPVTFATARNTRRRASPLPTLPSSIAPLSLYTTPTAGAAL